MDKYKLLCIDCGEWTIEDKKTGEVKTGTSYYLVVHKSDNCKPMVFKATENTFREGAKLVDMEVNILFDEKGRVAGINAVKS